MAKVIKYKELPVQVKASFWFLVCSFLQKGVTTITTPIFTRIMSTSEYGSYGVFNSWMSIVSIFVTLQLYSGLYEQGLIKFSSDRKFFSSSLQGLNLFLCLFWTVIYFMFQSFWNNIFSLTTVQMLAMLLLIWTSSVFRFWSAEQRVDYKYRNLVLITLLVSILNPFLSVYFVIHSDDKVTARILGVLLSELICYTGLFFVQIIRGRRLFSKQYWKYSLLFALPLVPHYLAQIVLSSSDRIMIQRLVGESESGLYTLAYTISSIMTLFNIALTQTISPWFYKHIKERRTDEIAGLSYIAMGFIAILNLLLILIAPEIVSVFAPKSYSEAIWTIPPVCMSVYFVFVYDFFAKFEFYFEKKLFIMLASIVAALINLLLNLVFIPIYGYIAAGYTTLFCYMIYALAHYLFMKKVVKKHIGDVMIYNPHILLSLSLVFLLFGFIFSLTYSNIIFRYVLIGIIIVSVIVFRKRIIELISLLRSPS